MSDIQLYLFEHGKNKDEAARIAAQTAQRLESKTLKLFELVESLGEYLNNDDTQTRAKAMAYLAEVLSATPQKIFTRQHRNLLCDFILSRIVNDGEGLETPPCLSSCAKGLMALEERGQWEKERVQTVLTTFIDNTHPLRRFKQQSERYSVLQLIDLLVAKYRDAVHSIHQTSPDFLSNFISYFDGEKDPRNLMVVFSILKVPMAEWTVGADAQDLFDAVFNYFPITFRPPPDDPYGITAQHLKDRLRECIASTGEFAPYSFPALLDKLDSTSMNTKRDVLQAIISCVQEYGPTTISLYSVTLWDALKFEILNSQEEDLAEEALAALAEIAKQLSQNSAGSLNAYLKPIAKESNEHLEDAPTKQSAASGRILNAVAKVSPEVADYMIGAILPNLFTLYQTSDTMAKRRGLVEVLAQLIRADMEVYGQWRVVEAPVLQSGGRTPNNALLRFRDQALELMSNGLATAPLKEVSFRLATMDGLLQLSKDRLVLNDEDVAKIIKLFHDVVISEESYGKDEMKTAAIGGLVEIAHQKPQLVIEKAFPAFMVELPDNDTDGSDTYVPVLEAFAKLGSEEQIFQTVVLRLKNKLNAAVQQQASQRYIIALLSAMLYAFSQGSPKLEGTADSCPYYDDIIVPLLLQIFAPESSQAFDNETALDLIGRLSNIILRKQPLHIQTSKISTETYSLFSGEKPEESPPFNMEITPERRRKIIVSTHILAALRREATLPVESKVVLTSLLKLAVLDDVSPRIRLATQCQVSLIVNKFIPTAELKETIGGILYEPLNLFGSDGLNEQTIRVIFAIIKGLALRNAPILSTTLPSLLNLLTDPKHGLIVARGFSSILQPDDILTKYNYCQVSGLHKQKVFNLVVPELAASFKDAASHTKAHYLIALAGVLRWLPYGIIEPELGSLIPLLLQSLDLNAEDDVKKATIDTLIAILGNNPKSIEEHASSLISRLLTTATTKTNPPAVRAVALKCLSLVPTQLRGEVVLPFKRQVVKKLTAALDDGKRAVRTEAVRCRGSWLAADEPDDDDD
ncbi:uncharacterized protein K452DRAFT_241456 [Aplosporella prunicola CBS 121167]|uniref:MMS19 nucleotide excision repair protein n=1 Tax=Aplosporella prunicola CBS 121167 TaxID=1176127 RepID=A0A6A6BT72_9PEZI|nr:uncharacterized protein K452DRAFT_241456 [Aplosporella prunicola CBS 121167]KAF2146583.1 hypothetical protein K452DRAFT_241456 [Aplosporella prunicola CBS 121167]